MEEKPYILTLKIDQASFEYFNSLRSKYFPPERNFIDAHITLFHQLPGSENSLIELLEVTAKETRPFNLDVKNLAFMGNGVAFKIESPVLQELHLNLQKNWSAVLTKQDQQKLWPHITVQNKVSPEQARRLFADLTASFVPFAIKAEGLSLWRYLGGPWEHRKNFKFESK